MARFLIFLCLLGGGGLAVAQDDDAAPESRHFYFGDCTLPVDPLDYGLSNLWLMSCVQATAGSEGAFRLGESEDGVLVNHAEGYYGLHLNYAFSVHAKVEFRERRYFDRDDSIEAERYVEYFLLRLGNPIVDRFRLQVGAMDPAFGVGKSVTPTFFEEIEPEFYWEGPTHGVQMSFDNLVNTQLDISVHNNELELEEQEPEDRDSFEQLVAARLAYDISALTGSRLVVSAAGNNGLEKRSGVAFVTTNENGDLVAAEVARISQEVRWNLNLGQQIIRFLFAGGFRDGSRWTFQLDDQAGIRRLGTLTYDTRFWGHFLFRGSLAYEHSLVEDARIWHLVTSLNITL